VVKINEIKMKKEVLIIGAGKIGRGFIAHLFYRAGYRIWLLDASKQVVELLNQEKKYRVDIAGTTNDVTEYIAIEEAFTLEDREKVAQVISNISIIASSVGAANIEGAAGFIKDILISTKRDEVLNWIICENANHPAKTIRKVLLNNADPAFGGFVQSKLGLIETQVLRTGMPANEELRLTEPLALRMQDWWTLPLDRDAFIGSIPDVEGFMPKPNFSNELIRKLYTFNGTNAPIAYIGWANGYKILHEAALAKLQLFAEIQEESAFGLIHEFGLDEAEQRNFMALAMKKYTDPALNDQIQRNAHDSKRKLGKHERLVGPASLCLKHGRMPFAYAKAIAAAYAYNGSTDPGTRAVQETVKQGGIEEAIKKYSAIDPSSALYNLIVDSYHSKTFIF
jgi:mannitol-1-phosphate 5-dehydrogenase